jgi:hypothetical protein
VRRRLTSWSLRGKGYDPHNWESRIGKEEASRCQYRRRAFVDDAPDRAGGRDPGRERGTLLGIDGAPGRAHGVVPVQRSLRKGEFSMQQSPMYGTSSSSGAVYVQTNAAPNEVARGAGQPLRRQ